MSPTTHNASALGQQQRHLATDIKSGLVGVVAADSRSEHAMCRRGLHSAELAS